MRFNIFCLLAFMMPARQGQPNQQQDEERPERSDKDINTLIRRMALAGNHIQAVLIHNEGVRASKRRVRQELTNELTETITAQVNRDNGYSRFDPYVFIRIQVEPKIGQPSGSVTLKVGRKTYKLTNTMLVESLAREERRQINMINNSEDRRSQFFEQMNECARPLVEGTRTHMSKAQLLRSYTTRYAQAFDERNTRRHIKEIKKLVKLYRESEKVMNKHLILEVVHYEHDEIQTGSYQKSYFPRLYCKNNMDEKIFCIYPHMVTRDDDRGPFRITPLSILENYRIKSKGPLKKFPFSSTWEQYFQLVDTQPCPDGTEEQTDEGDDEDVRWIDDVLSADEHFGSLSDSS